jgi:hypothetical protein
VQANLLGYLYSFIEYTSRGDAHRAVRKLSGTKLHGNVVALSSREVGCLFVMQLDFVDSQHSTTE